MFDGSSTLGNQLFGKSKGVHGTFKRLLAELVSSQVIAFASPCAAAAVVCAWMARLCSSAARLCILCGIVFSLTLLFQKRVHQRTLRMHRAGAMLDFIDDLFRLGYDLLRSMNNKQKL